MATSKNPHWLANVIDKPYDRVSWLITHNAFNNAPDIGQNIDPNQHYGIPDQLTDGVRAFMLDIHPLHGGLRLQHGGNHGSSYADLCELLGKIKTFLDNHPNEIVTLYCESYGDIATDLEETFKGRGPGTGDFTNRINWNVFPYLYHRPKPRHGHESVDRHKWPTIRELIKSNQRLVVFRELHDTGNTAPFDALDWYLDQWEYTCESPWNMKNWDDLQENTTNIPGRGKHGAPVFTLYHQPSGTTGGSAGFASSANLDEYLYARSMIAWKLTGKRPSPTVDFYRASDKMPAQINTLDTCERLNNLKEVHGQLKFGSHLFGQTVHVRNVENTQFASQAYGLDLSKYGTREPAQDVKVYNTFSFPLVPGETVNYKLELQGFEFKPDHISVSDFSKDVKIDVQVRKL